jgi:excisionase family DNA binding protein
MEIELLRLKEVASILKVSESNVKRMIRAGKLLASKVGKQWRIPKSEVVTYLEINQSSFGRRENKE